MPLAKEEIRIPASTRSSSPPTQPSSSKPLAPNVSSSSNPPSSKWALFRSRITTALREARLVMKAPLLSKVPLGHIRVKKEPIGKKGMLRWRFVKVTVGRLSNETNFHPVILYGKHVPETSPLRQNKKYHGDGGYKKARVLDRIEVIDQAILKIERNNLQGLSLHVSQLRRQKSVVDGRMPHTKKRKKKTSRLSFSHTKLKQNDGDFPLITKHIRLKFHSQQEAHCFFQNVRAAIECSHIRTLCHAVAMKNDRIVRKYTTGVFSNDLVRYINSPDHRGHSALEYAVHYEDDEMQKLFVRALERAGLSYQVQTISDEAKYCDDLLPNETLEKENSAASFPNKIYKKEQGIRIRKEKSQIAQPVTLPRAPPSSALLKTMNQVDLFEKSSVELGKRRWDFATGRIKWENNTSNKLSGNDGSGWHTINMYADDADLSDLDDRYASGYSDDGSEFLDDRYASGYSDDENNGNVHLKEDIVSPKALVEVAHARERSSSPTVEDNSI
eukprot:g2197.t1